MNEPQVLTEIYRHQYHCDASKAYFYDKGRVLHEPEPWSALVL